MWVELQTLDDKGAPAARVLVNLDATFAFQENADGSTNAVSITGVGVPVALAYENVKDGILKELG